ncbi:MAG: amino acid ABC transporter permease [Clostridia bacterium]|nr:amino acid ABC transporter permease [Clostridia bacterium]MBQ7339161.1 amino acid ABC transporter permease [Clostridia bacterium]
MDVWSVTLKLFEGFGLTCSLFLLTLVFSLPLGLVIVFGSMSKFKPLSIFCRTVVWIIRGTPLMLQLFVVFYVPGMLFNIQLFTGENGRFTAALVAFVINYACYFSEIYRGGIEGIPRGQYEAAQVLGMTARETFFTVILMQVIKRILAPISNEVITLVKDTSLARAIAVAEIFFINEMDFLSRGLIWPMFYIAVFFLLFVGGLTLLFRYLEKKLSYYSI